MPGDLVDYNNINNQEPYGDFPLRLLGTDAPYRGDRSDITERSVTGAQDLQYVPNNLQQLNNLSYKAIGESGDAIQSGIKAAQQADASIVSATEAANNMVIPGAIARAKINTYEPNNTPQYLDSIARTIGNMVQSQNQQVQLNALQKQKLQDQLNTELQKQQDKRDKDSQENDYTNADTDINKIQLNTEGIIKDIGQEGFEKVIASTLNNYPNLTAEAKRELINRAYSSAGITIREQAHETQKQIDEVNTSLKASRTQEFLLGMHGQLSALKAGTLDVPTFEKNTAQAIRDWQKADPSITTADAASAYMDALKVANQDASVSADKKAEVASQLTAYSQFLKGVQPLQDDYNNGKLDRQNYAIQESLLAKQYGIPHELEEPVKNPDQAREWTNQHQELLNKTDQLQQAGAIKQSNATQISNGVVGHYIALLRGQPGIEDQVQADPVMKNSPNWRIAIGAYKQLVQTEKDVSRRNNENDILYKAIDAEQAGGIDDVSKINVPGLQQLPEDIQKAQKFGTLTPEQFQLREKIRQNNIEVEKAAIQRNLQQNASDLGRFAPYGWDKGQSGFNEFWKQNQKDIQTIEQMHSMNQSNNPNQIAFAANAQNPNFNYATAPSKVAFASPVLLGRKVELPFAANTGVFQGISDGYGSPGNGNNQHHDKFHAGIDLSAPEGTPVLAQGYGRVIHSLSPDQVKGYGNMIDVQYQDGKIVRYGHLSSRGVREGDDIYPGEEVGKVGHTGDATGSHLHFEVRTDSGYGSQGTIDPVPYMAGLASSRVIVGARRDNRDAIDNHNPYIASNPDNAPTYTLPAGAIPVEGGYLSGGKLYSFKPQSGTARADGTVYNNAKPYQMRAAPTRLSEYVGRNDPTASYGYGAIARDPAFARKLAQTADSLHIPAQWLADEMANECGSKFDPQDHNKEGYGGLIGFGDADAKDYGRFVGHAYTKEDIWKMDRLQQLDVVRWYLSRFQGRITDVQSLAAAVFGGEGGLERWKRNPSEAYSNLGDGYVNLHTYVQRMGRDAGRSYAL